MDDLIKRSDAMRVTMWFGRSEEQYPSSYIKKRVMEIPTADRPQGEWIYWRDNGIKRCKCARCLTSYGCLDTPYCPNCGAKMKGVDNES